MDADFRRFERTEGVDRMADKGVQYVKLLVSNKQIAHIFNTHPQAGYGDYYDIDKNDKKRFDKVVRTYLCRIEQMVMMRKFIEERMAKMKTDDNKDTKHLIQIMGDFNIDARAPLQPKEILVDYFKENQLVQRFIEKLGKEDKFSEYDMLTHIQSGNGFDNLTDLAQKSMNEHPITKTTIDCYDENNKPKLMDSFYCDPNKDKIEAKTLDYMFALSKRNSKSFANLESFTVKVNKFETEEGKKYNQLSDHFGLEAEIDVSI